MSDRPSPWPGCRLEDLIGDQLAQRFIDYAETVKVGEPITEQHAVDLLWFHGQGFCRGSAFDQPPPSDHARLYGVRRGGDGVMVLSFFVPMFVEVRLEAAPDPAADSFPDSPATTPGSPAPHDTDTLGVALGALAPAREGQPSADGSHGEGDGSA